jgi:hypothetical protein
MDETGSEDHLSRYGDISQNHTHVTLSFISQKHNSNKDAIGSKFICDDAGSTRDVFFRNIKTRVEQAEV